MLGFTPVLVFFVTPGLTSVLRLLPVLVIAELTAPMLGLPPILGFSTVLVLDAIPVLGLTPMLG